ncbi:MAG: circadian phase modifier CpmA, partial [Cyanobacteriota bacterium]
MAAEARLDLGRRRRLGMVEAIWGEHKSADQIAAIVAAMHQAGELALVTRIDAGKAEAVARELPDLPLVFHASARGLSCPAPPPADPGPGRVTLVGGGTRARTLAAAAHLA